MKALADSLCVCELLDQNREKREERERVRVEERGGANENTHNKKRGGNNCGARRGAGAATGAQREGEAREEAGGAKNEAKEGSIGYRDNSVEDATARATSHKSAP